jgi:hypothetical protein
VRAAVEAEPIELEARAGLERRKLILNAPEDRIAVAAIELLVVVEQRAWSAGSASVSNRTRAGRDRPRLAAASRRP